MSEHDDMPPDLDASVANDPVAQQTAWTPVAPDGNPAATHTVQTKGPDVLVFRPRIVMGMSFALVLAALYSECVMIFLAVVATYNGSTDIPYGQLAIGMSVAAAAIVFGLRAQPQRWRFDRTSGQVSGGRALKKATGQAMLALDAIHALQIVREKCVLATGRVGTPTLYDSYELNLVLKDASRVNVADFADLDRLRADATTLASFLNIPLWDASEAPALASHSVP